MVPEKLFWTTEDTDGNPSSVVSIHVSVIPDAITGLSFTYASGDTYTLGSTEGETSTLLLEDGEELIRLDTALATVDYIDSVVLLSVRYFLNISCVEANPSVRSTQTTIG